MTDDSHTLQPNSMFGQHRIVCLLGRGGMGEVYEVEHELTGKRHAIKLLSDEVMEVPGVLERFHKEAKVMARMKHAGIVKVDLAGEDDLRIVLGRLGMEHDADRYIQAMDKLNLNIVKDLNLMNGLITILMPMMIVFPMHMPTTV